MIINSILDNDLYKFSMQNAVLQNFPDAEVGYRFINRSPEMRFNQFFYDELCDEIYNMSKLQMTKAEREFLRAKCLFLPDDYLEFLYDYRFNPNEVSVTYGIFNDLNIFIKGKWSSAILWEVPLMAMISELYFKHVDRKWSMLGQGYKAMKKGKFLSDHNVRFVDYGTRRRRSYASQDCFLKKMKQWNFSAFMGTSNVHFAHMYGFPVYGTVAHEWVMAISGLFGVIGANKRAYELWAETYSRRLAVALTDTFGTDIFFNEFNKVLAIVYDGLRQDSGSPFKFIDKAVNFYRKNGIDPLTKKIIFSDSLSPEKAVAIAQACFNRIQCLFGIGTNLTNDFNSSKALNIVIKLFEINGVNVVKLGDDEGKASGEENAVETAIRNVHNELCKNEDR